MLRLTCDQICIGYVSMASVRKRRSSSKQNTLVVEVIALMILRFQVFIFDEYLFTQVHERFFPLSWWSALFAAAAALHSELDAFEGGSSDGGQWTITASLCFFFNSSLDYLIDKVITSNNCIIISSVDIYLLFSHKKVSWNNNEARLSVQSVALYQSPSSRDLGIGASAGPLTSVSGWHPIRVLSVLELVSGATLGLENQLQVV